MSDPLKNVDPWDHVQKRKLWQESAQAEYSRVFKAARNIEAGKLVTDKDIHKFDFSQAEINAMAAALAYQGKTYYELESGQILRNVHSEEKCAGQACAIHHPSDHPLNDKPRSWQLGQIWRMCRHGIQHPDFDSLANLLDRQGWLFSRHKCCVAACCGIPELVEIDR